jgi:hypothetical protein
MTDKFRNELRWIRGGSLGKGNALVSYGIPIPGRVEWNTTNRIGNPMIKFAPGSKTGKIRFAILMALLLLVLVDLVAIPVYWTRQYHPTEGDFIFQSLIKSELVGLIEGATHSAFSHVGIVKRNKAGNWVVLEAMGTVHETPLWQYIARGRLDHFAVYRLKREFMPFIPAFIAETGKYQGRPYDYRYDMDEDFIYCSEFPYKAFLAVAGITLGETERIGDLDWKPFEKTIRKMDGGCLPLDRVLISPVNLSRADQLELVFNNGYRELNK